jgi:pilus assembly protein CpaB
MRVDVLVTGRPPGMVETVTATVLQNVAVLSAGQTIQAEPGKPSINTPVVTLLVNPPDAEALTLANNEGKIQLVLRNSTDQKIAATSGRQLRELYALERRTAAAVAESAPLTVRRRAVPQPAPLPIPAVPPVRLAALPALQPDSIIMIRGNQKTVERFQ